MGRNLVNNALALAKDLIGTLSRTSSDAHFGAFILCLIVAAESKHLPGGGLVVELVVALDLGELLVPVVLNRIVQLTFLV